MPVVRKLLKADEVYPSDLRYYSPDDTVQSFVNGAWVDNPQADPRRQTLFPPRLTFDPACDAAQSVVDALHGQIDQILEAIDNASTLFTIAGIILSIFTFGAYALFISLALGIADQMFGLGTGAIEAALTEPVYHTLVCILKCQMNSSGRLIEGALDDVESEVDGQIGGTAAIVLKAMLSLAGEGGINNLASIGTSTGDCSDCGTVSCTDDIATVYLGTVVERTDTYIIMDSEFNPGPFGTDRVAIGSGDKDICCRYIAVEKTVGGSEIPVSKYILCGTTLGGEEGYTHGYPGAGVDVSTVALDDSSAFRVKFTFAKSC